MARIQWHIPSLLFVFFLNWKDISGSKVTLTTSTPAIQPLLTQTLNLRCSLQDTASSSSVVGRSLSSSRANAKYVTSMFLFKDTEDIATVSEHTQAHAVSNAQNLNVSGAIPGGMPGEKGFLEVSVSYPTESQGGNYTCRISAIDDVGHPVIYSESVDVDVTAPTLNDLVHHVMIQDQQNKAKIASLESHIQVQDQKIHQLEDELNITRHVEGGVVNCGGDLGTISNAHLSRSTAVTFKDSYRHTPMVHVAVHDAGINKDPYYAYFHVTLVSVDTQGFTVECHVDNAQHYMGYLQLSWLSFPV